MFGDVGIFIFKVFDLLLGRCNGSKRLAEGVVEISTPLVGHVLRPLLPGLELREPEAEIAPSKREPLPGHDFVD